MLPTFNRRHFGKLLAAGGFAQPVEHLLGKAGAEPHSSGGTSNLTSLAQQNANFKRTVLLDFHFPEWDPQIIARASAQEIVDHWVRAHLDAGYFYMKDMYGNSYYNTRVGHKHQNLGDRDFFGECVQEAKRRGIKPMSYYCVNIDARASRLHPEWCMKDVNGAIPGPNPCYNARGYLDYVKAQVEEVLVNYPDLEGMYFDMLWFGTSGKVCYCTENCAPLFRQQYGIDIPRYPTWDEAWRKWLKFRYDSNLRFMGEINQVIRRLRPDIPIGYNYHAQPKFSWQTGELPVRFRLMADYAMGEAYPAWHGHCYPSLFILFVRGLKEDGPYLATTSRYTRMINDHTVRPEADLKWELFTYFSHGGGVKIVDTPNFDGTINPLVYDRLGRIYGEAKEKQNLFGHPPEARVALYFSSKSRDWYGRETPDLFYSPFIGAHKAAIESHVPLAIIFDENMATENLSRFPIVYLPNTTILTEEEASRLRAYVRQGGKILASLDVSLYDEWGRQRTDFLLADLFGCRFKGKTEFKGNYFRLAQDQLNDGIPAGADFLVVGPSNLVDPTTAKAVGELRLAFHDRTPETTIGHAPYNSPWKTVGPALVFNTYGKGQCIYLALPVDAAYVSGYPLVEHRHLIANLLRALDPDPPVRISAPANVETVVTREKNSQRHIIHFVQFQGIRDAGGSRDRTFEVPLMDESVFYQARMDFNRPVREARPAGSNSRVRATGNKVILETNGIHEAVVIDY